MSTGEGEVHPTGTVVTVRLWASARAAVGADTVDVEGVGTVGAALDRLVADHPAFAPIAPLCSLIRGGEVVTTEAVVASGDVLEVLPPFAGG